MDSATLEALGITKEDVIARLIENSGEDINDIIRSEIKALVLKTAPAAIEKALAASIETILDTSYQPVDEFGEPQRHTKPTTLRNSVKDRAVNYLAEKVNSDGKACNYNAIGTRADWIASKVVEKQLDYETKKEIEKAVVAAKAQLKSQVAQYIVTTLLNAK